MSAQAYRVAVATLRRVAEGLANAQDPAARRHLRALLEAQLDVLEACGRRRMATQTLARRVQQLERQLADRDPGERRAAICARLGVSRSRYYELRKVRNGSDSSVI